MSFVVAGLPRSRTAWSAVFLGAIHDPLVWCDSVSDYWNVVGEQGACDPSFAFVWRDVLLARDVPVVFIKRELEDAIEAGKRQGVSEELTRYMAGELAEMVIAVDPIVIPYEGLDMRRLWEAVKDDKYNPVYADSLSLLHVEQDADLALKQIKPSLMSEIMERAGTWQQ